MGGETQFTEYEVNRNFVSEVKSGPFPAKTRYTFEQVQGGTRVHVALEMEPGGFFKLAKPLLVIMAKRQFQADLANVRDLMQTHAL